MFLNQMNPLYFQKELVDVFVSSGWKHFLGCVILQMKMELFVSLVFYSVIIFIQKQVKLKNFFSEPFTHWPDGYPAFKRHQDSANGLHSSAHQQYIAVINNISEKSQPINILIDANLRNQIAENRKKLEPIVDTVKLCGRLCLPFRGHRDDASYHPAVGDYSDRGVGNFIELLNFRVRAGDVVLCDHLNNCAKNASYISKTTQNELINCFGQLITERIVDEVKSNKFFSIIADEAADCSNKEQLSLVLRFVDKDCNIREDFLGFLYCKWGLTGQSLAKLILDAIDNFGLNIADCRGQGYDGAGSVSGHINGLSAHILRKNQKDIYTHCHSHRLNLSISKSCSIILVRNVLEQIKQLSYFFNLSQNRQIMLEKSIATYCPESRVTKLKDVCRTRWVERITGMDTFEELFVPIYFTLDEMSLNLNKQCNRDTSDKACSFLKLISSFSFIVSLVITRHVFDLTIDVTTLLQAKKIDIIGCLQMIKTLKNVCSATRNNVNQHHSSWYKTALNLSAKVGVAEMMKRIVGKQTLRDNPPADSVSDYYKKAIIIPLLGHLKNELDNRFHSETITSYKGLSVIPAQMLHMISKKNKYFEWKEQFRNFTNFYEDDLPNPLSLGAEMELWENYWVKFQGSRPETIAATLKSVDFSAFANIKVALRLLATLPVTSCECERSFSSLVYKITKLQQKYHGGK